MNETELKKCPFCGGDAKLRTSISSTLPSYQSAWGECTKCGATGECFNDTDHNGEHIFKAIKAWNRRASE